MTAVQNAVMIAVVLALAYFPVLVFDCWSQRRRVARMESLMSKFAVPESVDAGRLAEAVAERLRSEASPRASRRHAVREKWEVRGNRHAGRMGRSRRKAPNGIQNTERPPVGEQS